MALEHVPEHTEALLTLGRLKRSLAMPAEAEEAFRRAVASAADGSDLQGTAHRELGTLLLGQARPGEALPHLQAALGAAPDHVPTLLQVAAAHGYLRDYLRAAQAYGRAADLASNRTDIRQRYADALQLSGQFRQAHDEYEQVLQQGPDNPTALNAMAWLLATAPDPSLRDPGKALALAQRAAARTSAPDASLLDTLAAAHAGAGEFAKAVEFGERALFLARRSGQTTLADDISTRLSMYRRDEPFVQAGAPGPR